MGILTADDSTLALLREAKELSEVRDASGAVIGFFAPVSIERAGLYAQAAATCDPTEAQRRKQSSHKTHTTQEVMEHLDSLRKS